MSLGKWNFKLENSRIFRYYLKGPKAGTHDVFVDGLPGMPDNIRPNGKGGFYITLFAPPNKLVSHKMFNN